jgi:hypothetical protein
MNLPRCVAGKMASAVGPLIFERKAPTAVAAAAGKNNEQKICRHRDGINMDVDVVMWFSSGSYYESRETDLGQTIRAIGS